MKKLLIPILSVSLLIAGCKTAPTDTQITLASALAARVSFTLIPASHRQPVAGYMFYAGSVIYALTDSPTPDGLTQLLLNVVPANDLASFPEIKTLIIPAVVDVYTSYYNQYSGDHTKLLKILQDIASGVQSIAAQYK